MDDVDCIVTAHAMLLRGAFGGDARRGTLPELDVTVQAPDNAQQYPSIFS